MNSKNQSSPMTMSSLQDAAEYLRLLGNPTRLRIVEMLLRGSYCVGELADACNVPSHVASEHLRLMQHCRLLTNERVGRKTYYRIADTYLDGVLTCIRLRFKDNTKSASEGS